MLLHFENEQRPCATNDMMPILPFRFWTKQHPCETNNNMPLIIRHALFSSGGNISSLSSHRSYIEPTEHPQTNEQNANGPHRQEPELCQTELAHNHTRAYTRRTSRLHWAVTITSRTWFHYGSSGPPIQCHL